MRTERKTPRKRLIGAAAVAMSVAGVVGMSTPAFALGTVTSGNYSGHSYISTVLRVQTLYSDTHASIRVCSQGKTVAGAITGIPKVCGSMAFAQWNGSSEYDGQGPGGIHTRNDGTTFTS